MPYEKRFVTLPEAASNRCDLDTLLELASEGRLKAFVIANDWPTDSDDENPISGYVQLLPQTVLNARSASHVLVREVESPSNTVVRLANEQSIGFGAVYVLREEIEKLLPVPTTSGDAPRSLPVPVHDEPGERAITNLERTIGALVHLIAHAPETEIAKHRNDGEVNAKQLAESIWTYLEAHQLSTTRLSVRTLQDHILKGLKALKRN